jgi:hypothetical protein
MEITAKEKKLISVVVYLHNDENTIVLFLEKILILFSKHFESFEIIVVNDCSFDNSIAKIQAHPRFKDYNISIVNMSLRQGLEISMSAGIDLAMGDFVYEFDDLTIDYDDALVMNAYNLLKSTTVTFPGCSTPCLTNSAGAGTSSIQNVSGYYPAGQSTGHILSQPLFRTGRPCMQIVVLNWILLNIQHTQNIQKSLRKKTFSGTGWLSIR